MFYHNAQNTKYFLTYFVFYSIHALTINEVNRETSKGDRMETWQSGKQVNEAGAHRIDDLGEEVPTIEDLDFVAEMFGYGRDEYVNNHYLLHAGHRAYQ